MFRFKQFIYSQYDTELMRQFVARIEEEFSANLCPEDFGGNAILMQFDLDEEAYLAKYRPVFGQPRAIRRSLKNPRVRRCFKMAEFLIANHTATQEPVARLEKYFGPILLGAYEITKFVPGENLYNYIKNNDIDENELAGIIRQVTELFRKMRVLKFEHGDLYFKNIIYQQGQCTLIDFESSKIHKTEASYEKRFYQHEVPHFEKYLKKLAEERAKAGRDPKIVDKIRTGLADVLA